MERVIISGATGAIGIALIQKFIENHVEVLVLCREDSARIENIPKHPLVHTRYCSLHQLCELQMEDEEPYDVFFHLAWAGTTGEARNDMYLQNRNVRYALDAVQLAHRFGCRKFIGAGSQAEYGRCDGPLTPDTLTRPENGYGMAKLCAGDMTRVLAHQLGMEHNWIRVLSVYGPYDGSKTLVMSMISQLLQGEIPQLTGCEQIWDFVHSSDAGNAFYLVAKHGLNGKVYVLGGGKHGPLSDYVEIIRKQVNPFAKLAIGAIPYGDKQVMHLQGDISELMEDTGFVPEISFEQGIRELLIWMKRNKK